MSDALALDTARKIEAIFAAEHNGGEVQRRAKIQCAVLDAIRIAALPPLRAREEMARLPAKLMQIADGALDDPADEAVVRDAADALVRLLSSTAGEEWRDSAPATREIIAETVAAQPLSNGKPTDG